MTPSTGHPPRLFPMDKNISDKVLSRRLSNFLLVMLGVLLLFNVISYLTIRQYNVATKERQRGYRILTLLERSLGNMVTMQSAVRGFVITQDLSYMDDFAPLETLVAQDLKETGSLLVLPLSKQRYETLKKLIGQTGEFLRQVLVFYERQGSKAAEDLIETDRGEELIDRIQKLVTEWRFDQQAFIAATDGRVTRAATTALVFLAFGSALAVFLLVAGGMVLRRELAAREKMEHELARLASIVSSSDDAIISKNLEGKILTWNQGAQGMFGFTAEEVVGRHISYIVPVTHQKEIKEVLERVARGERLHHFQTKRLTKDGRLLDISMTVSPLYNRRGRVIGVSAISRDITEQKRMEEEVRQAMEIKSRFISIASHELRSPLAAIREGVALVAEGLQGPVSAGQKEFLDVALRSIDWLHRLSTDILDFQRVESGQLRLVRAWHDAPEILDEVMKTVRPLADEKGLALTVRIERDLPRLVCDKDKVTQVVLNLVTNAVKFTRTGSVGIEARRDGDALHVTVRDTGPGIAPQDMPQLFQSFHQFGAASQKQGSGLGLFIAKQIVQAHNGRIWAESELGKGSVFHFTLPLQ